MPNQSKEIKFCICHSFWIFQHPNPALKYLYAKMSYTVFVFIPERKSNLKTQRNKKKKTAKKGKFDSRDRAPVLTVLFFLCIR